MRTFEVAGRFKTGMYEYDNKFMYTTLAAAQELTGLGDGGHRAGDPRARPDGGAT